MCVQNLQRIQQELFAFASGQPTLETPVFFQASSAAGINVILAGNDRLSEVRQSGVLFLMTILII